ncbi:hypothetical protein E4T49_05909 [Aureobasidium sp. EXF-10728]|nr:hypothetical protein E4T49_05909 [Aureobasidium sp. EXF-10728]
MASAAKSACRTAARQLRSTNQYSHMHPMTTRPFSSTRRTLADADKKDASSSPAYFNQAFYKRLGRDDQAAYNTLSPADRERMEKVEAALRDEFANDSRTHRELEDQIAAELEHLEMIFPAAPAERAPRNNQGFFQMGEKEDIGPDDDDFQGDDISSLGHAELEQTREIREYARLAGWEMPLLANLTKPYTPPTAATPLRFRYTTYMGEQHPAQRKVVVEFDPKDLSLNPTHTQNLIKLAGVRYNPVSNLVKMSCEDHETQAQNKRHLGDTIKELIAKAKAPESEWLKDVPVDFRHAKPKKRFQFPDEWLLTEERKKELEARREARLLAEQAKKESPAGLIDGIKEIEEARNIDLSRVEAPVMAEAKRPMAKGKQGKKEMRQGKA